VNHKYCDFGFILFTLAMQNDFDLRGLFGLSAFAALLATGGIHHSQHHVEDWNGRLTYV